MSALSSSRRVRQQSESSVESTPSGQGDSLQASYGNAAVGEALAGGDLGGLGSTLRGWVSSSTAGLPRDDSNSAMRDQLGRGGGSPLPGPVAQHMAQLFGRPFDEVRVHTGPRAQAAAGDLGAEAFTRGRDIWFGAGAWRPESAEGERLLVHELTHVAQDAGGEGVSSQGEGTERAAERNEQRFARGQALEQPAGVGSAGAGQGLIQRKEASGSALQSAAAAGQRAAGYQRLRALALQLRPTVSDLQPLYPAHLAARDALDVAATQATGQAILHTLTTVELAGLAVDHLLRTLPANSDGAGELAQEMEEVAIRDEAVRERAWLDEIRPTVVADIAGVVTPGLFRGERIAGMDLSIDLSGSPADRLQKLSAQVARSGTLVWAAGEIGRQLASDPPNLLAARALVLSWRSRPLDLLFLRTALGPAWAGLDEGPSMGLPSAASLLESAQAQARETGWVAEVGSFDEKTAVALLQKGGDENVTMVWRDLMAVEPNVRARLLRQLADRGQLDALCANDAVPWRWVKELHDSVLLAPDADGLKTQLQSYFLDRNLPTLVSPEAVMNQNLQKRFGPNLDQSWERADSLHKSISKLGTFGDGLNKVLNFATFGFHTSYGQLWDEQVAGNTKSGDFTRSLGHLAAKTALVGAVSTLTGGAAGKAVGGGSTAARAAGAGAVAGGVGGGTGLLTADAYDNYVSGDKDGFSSLEDYAVAIATGAAIGGVASGSHQAWKNRKAPQAPAPALPEPEGPSQLARTEPTSPYDMADPRARRHILDGDATGGGHGPGRNHPGKTEFPAGWTDEQIMRHASDIATDPGATPAPNNSNRPYNANGQPNRSTYYGVRDGVLIKVVIEPATQRIVTSYPEGIVDPAGTVHAITGVRIRAIPRNPGVPANVPRGRPEDYEPGL